ncbi:staygreen family protein [Alicyclobacillus dauci]|uniref:Staygreen family protein n=1 Tax=Alicyclobacillus dauci TaxID=1475485 RepID=A0ABY6YZQ6_9BACL|nr:staygreen family protein [Alicyclobacillus dauci]WAH35995.1 staygreen family protein [Alicyclobacillus dauci]
MAQRNPPKFRPDKLLTVFLEGVTPTDPVDGRHYTLTHSDRTGKLYLSVGMDYHQSQICGWYTKWKRDEFIGRWVTKSDRSEPTSKAEFHAFVHVSGGRIIGRAMNRNKAFMRELPRTLRAIRYGDAYLFKAHPDLDDALIVVHFESVHDKYNRTEEWGHFSEYVTPPPVVRRR